MARRCALVPLLAFVDRRVLVSGLACRVSRLLVVSESPVVSEVSVSSRPKVRPSNVSSEMLVVNVIVVEVVLSAEPLEVMIVIVAFVLASVVSMVLLNRYRRVWL